MSRELLRKALEALKSIPEAHECQHEETERLGVMWTRCQQCGRKWTDQDGPPKHRHSGVAIVMEEISAELAKPEPVALTDELVERAYKEIWRDLPSDFDYTAHAWIEQGMRYVASLADPQRLQANP